MNIFVLDLDPKKCAEYHNNSHCVKQLLETAQLLCGSHWVTGGEAPYKLSHKNHPSAIWTRECIENYDWLCELGIELCNEYTYRYGKTHKSEQVIHWCIENKPNIPSKGKKTPFAMAMPNECKIGDPIQSYRLYYITEKKSFATWKNREVPEWFNV